MATMFLLCLCNNVFLTCEAWHMVGTKNCWLSNCVNGYLGEKNPMATR